MFPKRLRRVIFDGVIDFRDVWYKANLAQDPAFDRNMNIWFGWLARYDSVYDLGSTQAEVRRLFYATQSRLYRSPAQGVNGRLGGSEWNDAFLYAGYSQSTWEDLGSVFSAYVRGGEVAPLEAAYLDVSGYGDDNGYAVYLGGPVHRHQVAAELGEVEARQQPHLPQGAIPHLGQRLVQRALPSLARARPDAGQDQGPRHREHAVDQ